VNKPKGILESMFGSLWLANMAEEKNSTNEQIESLVHLAFSYYENGKSDDAINYFKKALKIKKRADLYNNIGFVYVNEDESGKAANAFKNSLGIDPGFLPAFYNLGVAMYHEKAYDSAIKIFERIIKVPNIEKHMLVTAHNDKGCAYLRKEQYVEAIKSFETAVVLDDKFARGYVNIANAYVHQGKIDEARAKYNKALKIDVDCAAAYNGLGAICMNGNDFIGAKKYFDQALEKNKYCYAAYANKVILKNSSPEK